MLQLEKKLNGSIVIKRKSPFNSLRTYEILTINNKYPGDWILNKLIKMDCQRFNIVGKSARNNYLLKQEKKDDRISRDIADFFESAGGSIVL